MSPFEITLRLITKIIIDKNTHRVTKMVRVTKTAFRLLEGTIK